MGSTRVSETEFASSIDRAVLLGLSRDAMGALGGRPIAFDIVDGVAEGSFTFGRDTVVVRALCWKNERAEMPHSVSFSATTNGFPDLTGHGRSWTRDVADTFADRLAVLTLEPTRDGHQVAPSKPRVPDRSDSLSLPPVGGSDATPAKTHSPNTSAPESAGAERSDLAEHPTPRADDPDDRLRATLDRYEQQDRQRAEALMSAVHQHRHIYPYYWEELAKTPDKIGVDSMVRQIRDWDDSRHIVHYDRPHPAEDVRDRVCGWLGRSYDELPDSISKPDLGWRWASRFYLVIFLIFVVSILSALVRSCVS